MVPGSRWPVSVVKSQTEDRTERQTRVNVNFGEQTINNW